MMMALGLLVAGWIADATRRRKFSAGTVKVIDC